MGLSLEVSRVVGFRIPADGFEAAVERAKTLLLLLGERARVRGVAGCQVAFVLNFGRHRLRTAKFSKYFSGRKRTPIFWAWDYHAAVSFRLLRAAQHAIIPA